MLIDRVAALQADLDALLSEDLIGLSRDELLAGLRAFEAFKRRLPVADHRLVAEVVDRRLAAEVCEPSAATLLRNLLRIGPGEAAARVRAAADLGPRRSLLGEVLPPLFGRVATAQAAGIISAVHAKVIVSAVDKIPAALQAEWEAAVEAELVEYAGVFDPLYLQRIARHRLDALDPDGSLTDDADHARRREFALVKHPDGSAEPRGYLAPEFIALVEAYLDTHAAPKPTENGDRDLRSPGQRNYDAIYAGFTHLMTCGPTPPTGKPAQPAGNLILTMTAEQFETRQGYVTTPHGDLITVPTALQLVSGGDTATCVLFDPTGGVMSYGQTKRLVPPAMRLAITARDRGCTFPGCTRPAAWCECHHFDEYVADHGPTAVDNCALACTWHHDYYKNKGWGCEFSNAIPHWIPPAHINPDQPPLINNLHHPPMRT
jgi:hypothetical protein